MHESNSIVFATILELVQCNILFWPHLDSLKKRASQSLQGTRGAYFSSFTTELVERDDNPDYNGDCDRQGWVSLNITNIYKQKLFILVTLTTNPQYLTTLYKAFTSKCLHPQLKVTRNQPLFTLKAKPNSKHIINTISYQESTLMEIAMNLSLLVEKPIIVMN